MLVYIYFQIPLMVIVFLPAVDGLRPQWREAAETLGGTHLDVLAPGRRPHPAAPSFLGATAAAVHQRVLAPTRPRPP